MVVKWGTDEFFARPHFFFIQGAEQGHKPIARGGRYWNNVLFLVFLIFAESSCPEGFISSGCYRMAGCWEAAGLSPDKRLVWMLGSAAAGPAFQAGFECSYNSLTISRSLDCTLCAILPRSLFSTADMEAAGSTAATSTVSLSICWMIMLQGSIVPILSSDCRA